MAAQDACRCQHGRRFSRPQPEHQDGLELATAKRGTEWANARTRHHYDSSIPSAAGGDTDVYVQTIIASEPVLFADGFETGDTSRWAATAP
jgi:hypothetical protein